MTDSAADGDKPEDQTALNRLVSQKGRLLAVAAADKQGVSPTDFRVLFAAADHVHRLPGKDFGLLWPSVATLSTAAGTNPRSTHRALAALVAKGYLIPVRRGGGRSITGQGQSNVYRLGTVPHSATLPIPATMPDPATLPLSPPNVAKSGTTTLPDSADKPIDSNLQNNLQNERGEASARKRDDSRSNGRLSLVADSGSSEARVIPLASRKAQPKPWHVDSGATKDSYQPDDEELAHLRAEYPLTAKNHDLELKGWRAHEHPKPPKNMRDSFRKWLGIAEKIARERGQGDAGSPAAPRRNGATGRSGALDALRQIVAEERR
jgi:hypothetical protein